MLTHLHVAENVSYTTGEVVTGGTSGAVVESASVNHSATISSATNAGVVVTSSNTIRRWYASIIFWNINYFLIHQLLHQKYLQLEIQLLQLFNCMMAQTLMH